MAAGLGYIEFATGDILTAAAANGYLASQTVMVFASSSARSSAITSPQEGMMSYLKDTNSVEYYSGSVWTAVGGGGGGKILQVVQGTYATTVSTSSTSYVTTNLNATITPSATTSKILVIYSLLASNTTDQTRTTIYRGTVGSGTNLGSTNGFATTKNQNTAASSFLDSPSTTSATTYTIAGKVDSGTVYFFDGNTTGTIILMEVGA